MIISANRMSTMNGNYVIAANESYGVDDMGRILIENEMNDMAIFNAMLKCDMHEIQARNEGTLLESEIRALNESSIRDTFNAIIAKLKKFWAKIKGFFQKAYAMVTAYCVRNGKAFISANRKALSELSDDTVVKGKNFAAIGRFENDVAPKTVEGLAALVKYSGESVSSSDMTKTVLKDYLGKEFSGEEKPYEFMKKHYFTELTDATLKQYGGKAALQADLENGMSSVKALKKAERELEKQVKSHIKDLQKKANDAAKDLEGKEKDEKAKEADHYRVASTAVTNAMSTYTKALVKAVKFRLAQDRIVLAKAIGKHAQVESTLLESMILEAEEDIETLGDDTVDPSDVDLEEIKDAVVDAVEEVLDQEDGSASDEGDDE